MYEMEKSIEYRVLIRYDNYFKLLYKELRGTSQNERGVGEG